MNAILSAMQYPHWLMVAGAILVLLGFIGVTSSRNRNVVDEQTHEAEHAS
jgi:hypothetical protein